MAVFSRQIKLSQGRKPLSFSKVSLEDIVSDRIPLSDLSAFGGKFGGGVSREGFKYLTEIRRVSESHLNGDLVHREIGVDKKLLGFVDSVLLDISCGWGIEYRREDASVICLAHARHFREIRSVEIGICVVRLYVFDRLMDHTVFAREGRIEGAFVRDAGDNVVYFGEALGVIRGPLECPEVRYPYDRFDYILVGIDRKSAG